MTGLYSVVVVNPFVMSVPAWAQMAITGLPMLILAVTFVALGVPRQRLVALAFVVLAVFLFSSFGHAYYLNEPCYTIEDSWWAIFAPWCW